MTAIELFAGAGGLSIALKKAGFDIKALIEIDKNCCDTLRLNFGMIYISLIFLFLRCFWFVNLPLNSKRVMYRTESHD